MLTLAAAVAPLPHEPRFTFLRAPAEGSDFAGDVRAGLTAAHKRLPPRWFYDELGSALFDAICFLPEYYVMRAEAEALAAHREEIAASFGTPVRLVELGSGAARKTRILLRELAARQPELEYAMVDVDAATLERVGRELLREYAALRVTAICSDFTRPSLPLSMLAPARARTVVLFLGSTIGNLEPGDAAAMLRDLRSALSPGDALLLGADLRKERSILEAAYDDPLGVTAAFNRNMLARINRELGGAFDLRAFRHRAAYDEGRGCIDMYLASERAQRVRIEALDLEIAFDDGEEIHTESSYKYDHDALAALARRSGFRIEKTWCDARRWFADALLIAS